MIIVQILKDWLRYKKRRDYGRCIDRQKLCRMSKRLHSSFICMKKIVCFSLKFIAVDVHVIVHVCQYVRMLREFGRMSMCMFTYFTH